MHFFKEVLLKNNTPCQIRHALPEWAEEVLCHMVEVSGETDFMARYADEVPRSVPRQHAHLANVEADPAEVYLCAFLPGRELAGVAWIEPVARLERFCHRAELAIAIRRPFWGLGLGRALMEAVERCAREAGYLQLELEVAEPNLAAQALYHKMGFAVCGRIPNALHYRDGRFSDIYHMVKPLSGETV